MSLDISETRCKKLEENFNKVTEELKNKEKVHYDEMHKFKNTLDETLRK